MDALHLYAAGSLRTVFPKIIEKFQQQQATAMRIDFSPAGLLCEKIQAESRHPIAHLFASANTAHPQRLIDLGLAKSQHIFARNQLCLIVRNQPQWTARDWLAILLDEKTAIGMSTPKKDPSGDYAFSLFDTIEKNAQGQGERLKRRAKQLVGGQIVTTSTKIHPSIAYLLKEEIDAFIGYAHNANKIKQDNQLAVINIPTEFYDPIYYSIALLHHPHPYAQLFIDFLLSQAGQGYLQAGGFMSI
ncbi:molybdate ABC transporter substrate-binding protein [Orbaceae bacterium ESL0727]|nr:molybdate ABC transporter substrate-binding protein [Orbaceae bacterium ESL0727]